MIMATVGGTVSEITGGKFANGAVSGAFVHLFNAEARRILKPNEYNFKVARAASKEIRKLYGIKNGEEFVSRVGLNVDPNDSDSIDEARFQLERDLQQIGIIGLYGATKQLSETYYMNLVKFGQGKITSTFGLVYQLADPLNDYGFVYDCRSVSNCHVIGVYTNE